MNSIISGKNKHILVEGRDDKYLIERLWQDFLTQNSPGSTSVCVDLERGVKLRIMGYVKEAAPDGRT